MHDIADARWSAERIQDWAQAQPWICGFNYLPMSAVNFMDLWQRDTFDLPTIQRELKWAQTIGFNALRTNLSFVVWQQEGDAYLDRIHTFLDVAAVNRLKVVLCPFDDCAFSGNTSVYGKQPDPQVAVHNSRAIGSPGRERVLDRRGWPELEQYVKAVIRRFACDSRLLFWDLYNEPGNRMIFREGEYAQADSRLPGASLALMNACFQWARELQPIQPLTVAAWDVPYPFTQADAAYQTAIDQQAMALSDVISFHGYCTAPQMQALITRLQSDPDKRPLFCTEWMARHIGSQITDQLPLFKSQQVGAFNWGLVNGRTQTHLPWPFLQQSAEVGQLSCWFHDLLDQNGQAYDEEEIRVIRRLGAP